MSYAQKPLPCDPLGARNYLAVSGGGSDGAFGAGLLVGPRQAPARNSMWLPVSARARSSHPLHFLGPTTMLS